MITLLVASMIALAPQDCGIDAPGLCGQVDSRAGLPTIPPALPTQIVNGDGTRMTCTPAGNYCWPAR